MSDSGDAKANVNPDALKGRRIITETDRLAVCAWNPDSDAQAFYQICQDPGLNKYSVTGYRHPNVETARAWLQKQADLFRDRGMGAWAVYLKDSGELIGLAGLRPIRLDDREEDEHEIMYRFVETQWGQGLGTEAAVAVLEYGLNRLKAHDIIGFIDRRNSGSRKVLIKAGMTLTRLSTFRGLEVEVYSVRPNLTFPRSTVAVPSS